MVRPGLCGCVCAWFDLRVPAGSLAFWIDRGCLGTNRCATLVVDEGSENGFEALSRGRSERLKLVLIVLVLKIDKDRGMLFAGGNSKGE